MTLQNEFPRSDEIDFLETWHQEIQGVLEVVDFYRKACVEHEYSEEMVDSMVLEFHRLYLEEWFCLDDALKAADPKGTTCP